MNVYYSSTPLRLYFDLKKMEDSHHKDLEVNEKVARIYKPRLTVIPFFDLKESVFTSPAIILTSFADETEWFVTVIVIPSSPVITLIHNTTLFIFTIVVLTLFPILESGVNTITKDTSCNRRETALALYLWCQKVQMVSSK